LRNVFELVNKTRGDELVRQSTAIATGALRYGKLPSDGDTHSIAPEFATRADTVTALKRHPPVPKSSVSGVPDEPCDTTHAMVGSRRTGVPPSIDPRTGDIVDDVMFTAYSIDAPESNALTLAEAGRITTATDAVR
jgi:hypothetical protein